MYTRVALEEIQSIRNQIKRFETELRKKVSKIRLGKFQIIALKSSFYCGFPPGGLKAPKTLDGIPIEESHTENEITLLVNNDENIDYSVFTHRFLF